MFSIDDTWDVIANAFQRVAAISPTGVTGRAPPPPTCAVPLMLHHSLVHLIARSTANESCDEAMDAKQSVPPAVHPYVDHAVNFAIVLAFLAFADHLWIKPFVAKRCEKSRDQGTARWFFIHSLANAFVCLSSLSSIRAVLRDPLYAFDGAHFGDDEIGFFGAISVWPLTIINAVHVYHMVGGFKLSSADYFHHGLFIPTIALPGQIFRWGPLSNFQAFFISGLPGGIDYFLLGMQKVGKVHHIFEKRINANLNTWLRVPGILISTTLCCQGLLYGHCGRALPELLRPPMWAMFLQVILPPYNALYFGKQACANYAVHYMLTLLNQDELIKARIEQRTSVTTGTEIMAWKDALSVPQRGS